MPDMSDLFPTWAAVLADTARSCLRAVLNDGGQLYRVVQATPGPPGPHDEGCWPSTGPSTEHAGTADDPIPGVRHGRRARYRYNGKVYQVAEGGI